jgi:hypothetical protein
VADDAAVLLVDAGQEAGHVDEGDERDVERVAGAHEAGRLLDDSMSSTPASTFGWLPTMPTGMPSMRAKPHTIDFAQCGKYSKNSPSSTTWRITSTMS